MTESSVTTCVSLSDSKAKQMFRSSLSSCQMYCLLTLIEEQFDMVQWDIPASVCFDDKVQKVKKKSVFVRCLRREMGMELFRTLHTHTLMCVYVNIYP